MSIRNAGKFIKWMRLNRGMSQEDLSEGICSTVTLSKIENNKIEAKSQTFNALCKKMGSTETKYPCFKSEKEFQIVLNLHRARCYMSIGEYHKAVKEMLNCEFTSEIRFEIKAEFLFLVYVIVEIVRGRDNRVDCLIDTSLDLLKIRERKKESFITVLEYEIYMFFNMLNGNTTEIIAALDVIKKAPMMASEKEFVRMMGYACLSYIYKESNMTKAREFAIKAIKLSFKSGRYCLVFDLYDIALSNDGFHHTIKDVFGVYGTGEKTSKDEINKLIQSAVKVSKIANISTSDKVYSTAEILKNTKGNLKKESICRGVCAESTYGKFLAGISMPSAEVFECLIERCGFTSDSFVLWGAIDSDCGLDTLGVGLISNSRFSIREIAKIERIATKFVEEGRMDEAQETLRQLIIYLKNRSNDISFLAKIFPDVVNRYVDLLYDVGEFEKIVNFIECRKYPEFLFDIRLTGEILQTYCKACAKLDKEAVFAKRVVEVINEMVELNEK